MCNNERLIVRVDGIDMEMEARVLLRLFFDESYFSIINGKNITENNSSLLAIEVISEDTQWSCKVDYYECGRSIEPLYTSYRNVSDEDLDKPGGVILKSRKILVGTAIVDVLSKVTGKKLPYGSLTGIRPVKLAMHLIDDGMDREEASHHLINTTGMNLEKANLLYDVAMVEKPFINSEPDSVHLYINIPFCASRCLYCSFTSYPIKRYESLVPSFLDALEKEMRKTENYIFDNQLIIKTVYIGGGTPTSLDNKSFQRLLSMINEIVKPNGVEFTVEAGRPDTITLEKLQAMRRAEVTRISINPQSMNQETLKLIGRNHSPQDTEQKFNMAREVGFNNINMDIIAGLPGEDEQMFNYTLGKIEKMKPESLTVHTMALKRASLLHEDLEKYNTTHDEVVEKMISNARNTALKIGMRPYYLYRQKNILANLENIGYSKPGFECLYNIHTMEECQSILALGPGAISKHVQQNIKKIERTSNVRDVAQYIDRINE